MSYTTAELDAMLAEQPGTPLPYHAGRSGETIFAEPIDYQVRRVATCERQEDNAYLLTAANAHHALAAQLREALVALEPFAKAWHEEMEVPAKHGATISLRTSNRADEENVSIPLYALKAARAVTAPQPATPAGDDETMQRLVWTFAASGIELTEAEAGQAIEVARSRPLPEF